MKLFDWIGHLCVKSFIYLLDLSFFVLHALSVWHPHRTIYNRAVYSIFIDQLVLTGINAIAIIGFLAVFVGIVIASQLVFIIVSVAGAKDYSEILARLILSEMGPLITGFIMIGRSCTAMVADLGNCKIAGELDVLRYQGINIDDILILPRILGTVISQLSLALYFSAIMLLTGMLFSTMFYDFSLQTSISELLHLIDIGSLGRFILKNILFGLTIGSIACFHGLSVVNSPTQISRQLQYAVVRSIVFVFLIDGYFILFTL